MPYDDAPTQKEEQRSMEKESAGRQKGAATSPLQSSGAGGFKSNAPGSGSANAAPAPGTTDGGLSGGVIHSGKQEQNIRDKAIGGGVITNDDLGEARGYLGHFAKDSVLQQGHNAGMQKKGKAPLVKTMAQKGYRKLGGSAAPQIGVARGGVLSSEALGLRPPRFQREAEAKLKASTTRSMNKLAKESPPKMFPQITPIPLKRSTESGGFGAPKAVYDNSTGKKKADLPPKGSKADIKMSARHHKDSIDFNLRHAKDHEREAVKHERALKTLRRERKVPR